MFCFVYYEGLYLKKIYIISVWNIPLGSEAVLVSKLYTVTGDFCKNC